MYKAQSQEMRVLAVSSGGGHWDQLMLIRGALREFETIYATTFPGLFERYGIDNGEIISDCNRADFFGVVSCIRDLILIIKKYRPHVIITTGAAPGLLALCVGKFFGSHLIWIDSIANSEKISLSGRLAALVADVRITQWEKLSSKSGIKYLGSVI